MFTIQSDVVNLNASFLKHSVRLPVVPVDNHPGLFFRCCHSNMALHRLLVAEPYVAVFGCRATALRRTDIMKTIKDMKDAEWAKQVENVANQPELRRYTRELRTHILTFASTVKITAPRVANVEGIEVEVELSKPTKGLVMELSSATLEYLRNVVSAQLDIGMSSTFASVRARMDPAHRVDTGVQNLWWSQRLNKYRAAFYPPDAIGNKRKRLEYSTTSKANALSFIETGIRPIASEGAGSDVEPTEPVDESGTDNAEESETEIEDDTAYSGITRRPAASSETPEGSGIVSDIV